MYTNTHKRTRVNRTSVLSVIVLCFIAGVVGCSTSVPIRHVIVHKEPGRFCGWPANYGTWSWGNEILVGFKFAYYQAKERGHSYNREKPSEYVVVDAGKAERFRL
ncbi:MAG: hypothetical protein ACYS30_25880 [Planctomycetota bacterium]|jgi:hypothetical protein